ncbi:MAG: nucleotidyltransferase family protein [Chloroflexi bacterium]|nr:nucleotidyltransferase family protein [Chloroflexota bacterium]
MYALTIAGGRGERLKPFTDTLPKAMIPVNDRPLISYQVVWLRRQGVTDVVFLCGYLGEKIQEYFGDGARFGIRAHYSVEQEPLGRGGAVRKGLALVPESEKLVVVANGDNVTDQPLGPLIDLHHAKGAMATMMLVPYPSQYGVVEAGDDQLVTAFVEKGRLPFWINAGNYVFDRAIGPLLPEKGDHETTTFPILAERRRLAALKSRAFWMTVDSSKDLREASERLMMAPATAPPDQPRG